MTLKRLKMYLKIHVNAVLYLVGGTRENFKIQKAKRKKKSGFRKLSL